MMVGFINAALWQQQKERQLHLARQHAKEWQDMLNLEIVSRSALEMEHQEEMRGWLAPCTYREQASIVNRQLRQLLSLKMEQQIIRKHIRLRQSQERAALN